MCVCVSSGGIDIKQLAQWVKIIAFKGEFLKLIYFKATKFEKNTWFHVTE